jgi:signal transduction histidine kinase
VAEENGSTSGRPLIGWQILPLPSSHDDPERIIGIGRLLISAFALAAVYLDPTQPANLVDDAYWILSGYVAFAVAMLLVRPMIATLDTYKLTVMAIDITVAGLLVYITDELESPFLTFFTFVIISAAIRWEWRGTLVTAGILQGILIAIGLPDLKDGESELNSLIIRSVFCWVNVFLLGYFGSYRERSNRRLRELASWPHDIVPEQNRPWLSASLRHALMVLGANSIAICWRDKDKPVQHLAVWGDEGCRFVDLQDGGEVLLDASPQVATELGALVTELPAALVKLLGTTDDTLRQAYICGFDTIRFRGCAIVVEPGFRDRDAVLLTQIIASRIAMELEQFSLVREYASAAALTERARIARDLHDSILQDLTAAALKLEATLRAAPARGTDLISARNILQSVQEKVRGLVDEARPDAKGGRSLADILEMFVEPLEAQWNCHVRIEVDPPTLKVSETVVTELCLTLAEATANAARHGNARNLRIDVRRHHGRLHIMIEDDGTGGGTTVPRPSSIQTRIEGLGGTLAVDRLLTGLRLEFAIPLDQPAS